MTTATGAGVPAKQITDEDVSYMKSFIGESAVVVQWNEEASTDSIRHYAWGIGDENPLWLSDSYAQTTRYGTRIAPPTFLYSVCDAEVAMGMSEGIQAIHLGADLDHASAGGDAWHSWQNAVQPLRRGRAFVPASSSL